MLFHRQRKKDVIHQAVDALSIQSKQQSQQLKDLYAFHSEAQNTLRQQISQLEQEQKEIQKLLRRQRDSFEDFLEEFQEQNSLQDRCSKLLDEAQNREQALLSLACRCREQIDLIANQILKDDSMPPAKKQAWQEQFRLMEQEDSKLMSLCSMEETGAVGEPVDYDLHEILNTVDTADGALAGTVAKVYCRGRIYAGKLIKKARVAAYKQTG